MEINVAVRHGRLSDGIQETIHGKVEKLPQFFNRTTGIEIVVDLKQSDEPSVELKVSAEETDDFFAADTGANILAALDGAMRKVEQQMRKHKEKLTGHRSKSRRFEPS